VSAITIEDVPNVNGGGVAHSHPLARNGSISVASTASLFGGSHRHRGQQQSNDQGQVVSFFFACLFICLNMSKW